MKSIISILEKHGGKILTLLILTRLGYMLSRFFGLFSSSGGDGIVDMSDRIKEDYGSNVMTGEGMKSHDRIAADIEQLVVNGFGINIGVTGWFNAWSEDEGLIVSILNRYEPHNYVMLSNEYYLRTQKVRWDFLFDKKDGRDLRLDCEKYLSPDELGRVSYLWLGG